MIFLCEATHLSAEYSDLHAHYESVYTPYESAHSLHWLRMFFLLLPHMVYVHRLSVVSAYRVFDITVERTLLHTWNLVCREPRDHKLGSCIHCYPGIVIANSFFPFQSLRNIFVFSINERPYFIALYFISMNIYYIVVMKFYAC
jgi:hypothetical protein